MSTDAERRQRIEAQFGRAADQYATSEHKSGSDLEAMLDLAQPIGSERVLDIATGAGHTARAFAPNVQWVVVTDLITAMIEKARALFAEAGLENAEFRIADAQTLPFADAEFDIVTCRIAPHHFPDILGATQEVRRVLKPDGKYVLVDSLAPDDKTVAAFLHEVEVARDPTHVRSYDEAEWCQVCEQAGLEVVTVERYRKRRTFEFWLDRGGAEGDLRDWLRERFRTAPPHVRGALDIEISDGRVQAFSDDKIVLLARHP